jgi:putative redox protein
MEQNTTTVTWQAGMAFTVELDGHSFSVDAKPEVGGEDRGPRPKGLVLSALGGCTGMDVVSILAKMRVPLEAFRVEVEAPLTDEHPRVYSAIHIRYFFRGKDLPMDKLERAVQLSQERYCGVSALVAKAAPVTHEIVIEA